MPGDWTGFFRQWEPLRALEQEGWGDLKGEVDGTGLVMLQSGAVSPCPPARQPGGGGGGRIFRFLSVVLEDSVDPEAAQSPPGLHGPTSCQSRVGVGQQSGRSLRKVSLSVGSEPPLPDPCKDPCPAPR